MAMMPNPVRNYGESSPATLFLLGDIFYGSDNASVPVKWLSCGCPYRAKRGKERSQLSLGWKRRGEKVERSKGLVRECGTGRPGSASLSWEQTP